MAPLPSVSGIYRALRRHGLIEPKARRKKLPTYKRWERGRPMELWQMDVVGGVLLDDGRGSHPGRGQRNDRNTWPEGLPLLLIPPSIASMTSTRRSWCPGLANWSAR